MIERPHLCLSRRHLLIGTAASAGAALLAACGGGGTATDTPKPAAPTGAAPTSAPTSAAASSVATTPPIAPTAAATAATGNATTSAGSAVAVSATSSSGTASGGTGGLGTGMINGMTWEQILAKAKGGTANWFLYGGSTTTNDYLDKYVIPQMQQFGVTVKRTPVTDTVEAVNKVLAEKQAGKATGGSIDMIWINGENFRTMADANILFTDWAQRLPNAKLIAWDEPVVNTDFGISVNGREAPWARAQFIFINDSAKVATPWKSFAELETYLKANPGKFTYPAPPDFTGSAFIRHVLYETTGGWQQYGDKFNESVYTAKSPLAWEYLNRIKPLLWQKGATYPEGAPKLDQLFADGEVNFTMNYSPTAASVGVATGKFPKTTRSFYLTAGTIANVSYITIPANAANKEAALVLANFLESPEAQMEKAKQTRSGDATVLNVSKLSDADRTAFKGIPLDEATIPSAELSQHALPELPSVYVDRIEKDWTTSVLKK